MAGPWELWRVSDWWGLIMEVVTITDQKLCHLLKQMSERSNQTVDQVINDILGAYLHFYMRAVKSFNPVNTFIDDEGIERVK